MEKEWIEKIKELIEQSLRSEVGYTSPVQPIISFPDNKDNFLVSGYITKEGKFVFGPEDEEGGDELADNPAMTWDSPYDKEDVPNSEIYDRNSQYGGLYNDYGGGTADSVLFKVDIFVDEKNNTYIKVMNQTSNENREALLKGLESIKKMIRFGGFDDRFDRILKMPIGIFVSFSPKNTLYATSFEDARAKININ
ncbi:MAG: hypothetical protein N3A54_01210 [Patescibacteria group bacterium]|nr:hypothetical protein [Patescibacteria group bacterium]